MPGATFPEPGPDAPHILLAMNVYWEQFVNVYSLLAVALRLRGVRVSVLVNDGALPACEKCLFTDGGVRNHAIDHKAVAKIFSPLGVRILRFTDFINRNDRTEIEQQASTVSLETLSQYAPAGIAIGEQALAGALRFYAKGTLADTAAEQAVVRQYLLAALVTERVIHKVLSADQYTAVCCHHGIYIPQGIVGEVARAMQIRVVNWNVAYREKCFIFSHSDTYHHTLLDEPTSVWEQLHWTEQLDKKITEYLLSRHRGSKDWISFNRQPEENKAQIIEQLQLNSKKPIVVLLTNVIWDAQLHYRTNIFSNMIEWVIETIKYFAQRPDIQLVIRIHPAELKGTIPSRQPMLTEIRQAFPTLPANIKVIPPDSSISTYVVSALGNAAIIYGTKTGVELVSSGIPTIVAGEAWIKHKGLTIDPTSIPDYFATLDHLPFTERLSSATIQRAKRYAYHFFFRRMIPLRCVQPTQSIYFRLQLADLQSIMPGSDPGLDVICQGIQTGSPFIYQDEITTTASQSYWLDMR